jgi:hypothetical protein
MAKKTTMKRKMKKGTRKYRGGVTTRSNRTLTPKMTAHKASVDAKRTGSKIKQELKKELDELTSLFEKTRITDSPNSIPK